MATAPTHFLEDKKIIVAGSGIAGLSFAIALRQLWDASLPPPKLVLYDRDAKEASVQRKGYSLSLNAMSANGGLVALKDLGLLDQILECSILGTDNSRSFRLWDSDWGSIMRARMEPYRGIPAAEIRIRRCDLRNILVEAAGEDRHNSIVWDTSCVAAERLDSGRIRVQLSRPRPPNCAQTAECDILIAADGANSKIRASLRPADTLRYASAVQIGGIARFPQGLPAPINQNWGMVVSGQGVGCFLSPVDEASLVWGLSRREPEPRPSYGQSTESFEALMKESLDIGHMIAEPFPTIVKQTTRETSFVHPARDKPPFGHHEGTAPAVVFIGDSNHAASPFAGNGANLALKDGWDLAAQLCKHESLEAALAAYDELSVPRAVKTIKTSHRRIALTHCTGIRYYAFRVTTWFGSWKLWLTGTGS